MSHNDIMTQKNGDKTPFQTLSLADNQVILPQYAEDSSYIMRKLKEEYDKVFQFH